MSGRSGSMPDAVALRWAAMEQAYRDNHAAALARIDALEAENARLRGEMAMLERRVANLTRPFVGGPQFKGPAVLLALIVTIGTILAAALFMTMQMHRPTPAPSAWPVPPASPYAPPLRPMSPTAH